MLSDSSLMAAYAPLPVYFQRGQGAWLYDSEGRPVLDGIAGIAVCSLGHAHPEISSAIADQAGRLMHTSNLFNIELTWQLAARLAAISGMEKVFFCNSGTEANEAAIKIALLAARRKGVVQPRIVVCENAFHGRSMGSLSATGSKDFAPLLPCFVRIPFNDVDAMEKLQDDQSIVAVMLEPVQGDGGVNIPSVGYLRDVRRICDRMGWLMMLDEVQTGMCRTGRWFAFEHEGIRPDVLSLAKALGNGFPMGACLVRGEAAGLMQPGLHGSTFGGNPLAARVALAVIDIMERDRIAARAEAHGREVLLQLQDNLASVAGVTEVRGMGMLLGIELESASCANKVPQCGLEHGVLLSCVHSNVVRLLPPLIMDDEERNQLVQRTVATVRAVLAA